MSAADRRRVFLDQARSAAGRSPLYDDLWRRLADDARVDDLVDEYRWDTPLKLVAALHYLVLDGRASWGDVDRALDEEREFLRAYVADQPIQTNEVQRCWMLLPCFLEAARRTGEEEFDVVEIGPSAGLNLLWDRHRYRYANGAWGDADARLELTGKERAPVPGALLAQPLRVLRRRGIDVAPLDVTSDSGAHLLRSFVWPDMADRLERLDTAIEVLRADPPQIVEGDVTERLPELLAGDRPVLVYETMALAYLSREGRQRVYEAVAEAGAQRTVAFVRTASAEEATHASLELQVWPGGERERLAQADFHGAWIDWLV